MKPESHLAICCTKKDEKTLMGRVNEYLEKFSRTTSKAKHPDMLRKYLPRVIKHYYWNLNKDAGTWFDIYPNEDVHGEWFFPEHKDCAWILHIRIDLARWSSASADKADSFLHGLLNAIGFPLVTLQESDTLS